jgi:YfiH family protein
MQFKILKSSDILHGVSGVKFGSMKDRKKAIKFLESLGYKKIKLKNLVWAEQVFGSKIHICKKEDGGREIKGVDGLITNLPNQILSIRSADCLPILIYDKKKKVVAAIHGGRECLVKGILKEAIKKMKKNFKTKPQDLLVAIGPHIRVCHYWLKEKTYQRLKRTKFKKYFVKRTKKIYFDLTRLAIDQLLNLGIKKENIEDSKICTFCHWKRFFSFRKMEGNPKIYSERNSRFASFIGLLKF